MKAIILSLLLNIAAIQYNQAEKLQFVSRDEWLAEPETAPLDRLRLPVSKVIVAHTATEECSSLATCAFTMRIIQQYHISKKYFDIGYNFLISSNGLIYEGRGWGTAGAHTKNHNSDSICIAFIGNFEKTAPTRTQLQAAQLLLEDGVTTGALSPEYKLYGHRQLTATISPGAALYEAIKTWPHWCSVA